MRVLVTRPQKDAEGTASLLAMRGIDTVIEPLIRIEFVPGPEVELDGMQALLVTSANGLRAFVARNPQRGLKVLAVGDASARAAREAGFADVASASGDVEALAALAGEILDPRAGALLHVAGSRLAGDLAGLLRALGFDYRREVLYRSRKADRFQTGTEALLRDGALDGVLLYSPRTAAAFAALATGSGLADCLGRLTAYCLSQAVADQLAGLPFGAVAVAARPEQEALLELLGAG